MMPICRVARIKNGLKATGEAFLSLLYPPHCALCSADVDTAGFLCDLCKNSAKRIQAPFCSICSQPFDGAIEGPFSCAHCDQRGFQFENAVACYRSRGVIREMLHRFKYQNEFHLRNPLAEWLMEGLLDSRIASKPIDCIVPVPLHPSRERERGFNQAQVLADMITRRTGTPLLDCLIRVRMTTTQTRLDRAERMENLLNAFKLRHNCYVRDKQLVLVDDVFTTGATVDECARVLMKSGAASVRVMTVARG